MQLRTPKTDRSARRGTVLIAAVMIMMLVATMTLAFLQIGVRFSRELSTRIDDERALIAYGRQMKTGAPTGTER